MKHYTVNLAITQTYHVKAENEYEAEEKAYEMWNKDIKDGEINPNCPYSTETTKEDE